MSYEKWTFRGSNEPAFCEPKFDLVRYSSAGLPTFENRCLKKCYFLWICKHWENIAVADEVANSRVKKTHFFLNFPNIPESIFHCSHRCYLNVFLMFFFSESGCLKTGKMKEKLCFCMQIASPEAIESGRFYDSTTLFFKTCKYSPTVPH